MGAVSAIPESISKSLAQSARRETANFNMDELRRSSALEQANAAFVEQAGATQAGLARMRGSAVQAQQRVAWATAGIDTSTGTPAAVGEASRLWSELDAVTLQNNARRAAMGHRELSRRYDVENERIAARWRPTNNLLGAPAELEFESDLALSGLGAALSAGLGAK
ncbi:MAG: hypothetical protein DI536_04250 [Archangium gephyra]|uniref:Uncharacterized protein n=1 Tax=Archangium gephyra TaxID=48 RepID=A0A2W5W306_9BACT|nr:MAG: hypothetical protein DI536_04250 [Archangium gephyra]